MTLSATNQLRISTRLTGPGDLGTDTASLEKNYSMRLANGTGTNQADLLFKDTRTVASGATDDMDLNTVLNPFGAALAAAEVVTILIVAASANTTNLTIGGSSADFAGLPDQTITPGGMAFHHNQGASGLGTVTNGSSDIIRVVNASGAAATYEIMVIGRSA